MPGFTFGLTESGQLKGLADMPELVRSTLREGYEVLGKLPAEKYRDVISAAMQARTAGPGPGDAQDLQHKLGISRNQAGGLLTAAIFLFLALEEGEVKAEAFIKGLRESSILAEGDEEGVLAFAKFVFGEPQWKKAIEQARLGSGVLPSVSQVKVAIDVRLRFDPKDTVTLTVPVAVMHIDTDTEADLWVQATQQQLEKILETLQTALRRLKIAAGKFGG